MFFNLEFELAPSHCVDAKFTDGTKTDETRVWFAKNVSPVSMKSLFSRL